MRIAVINRTGGGISGGYKRYLLKVLPGFCADARVEAVLCAAPEAMQAGDWLPPHPKLSFAVCPPFRPFRSGLSADLLSRLDEFRPDVIFVPVERSFSFGKVPVVSMIQNMAPLKPSGSYRAAERLRMLLQRLAAWRAAKSSAHMIAMSEFVRDFLLHEWDLPEDKVSLVYFGAPEGEQSAARPAGIPADWVGSYLFSAGSLEPYRGLEDLISAAGLLKRKGAPVKLAIAGGIRPAVSYYAAALRSLAEREGVADDIVWMGHVGTAEINWCYRNCAAFVMTSRVEALAVIILEALANRCLCVSADNPPFPEAFGDAALYYKSGDSASLAARLEQVLGDKDRLRAVYAVKAEAALKRFTWEETVNRTLAVLQRAASGVS